MTISLMDNTADRVANKDCPKKVMLVEDDDSLREAITEALVTHGYIVNEYDNGVEALRDLREVNPGLIISDVQMDTINGYDLLASIEKNESTYPVVLITAYGSVADAVSAIKLGAKDYLVKPFDVKTLISMVERHIKVDVVKHDHGMIADDATMKKVVSLAKKVARNNATLMITGESGTGKEVLSRYIHEMSNRSEEPFIAINCAAIPENMLEATLFGYEKGAFTGATQSCPGKFELAQNGTILLDEISEMDLALQAKILRVLQEKEVERLGGKKTVALDVRVIATSNRAMKQEVNAGRFREDLYYRLNVFPLRIPSLRERKADIEAIARHFLFKWRSMNDLGVNQISPDAVKILNSYHWPGNVRELENVIQRAIILSEKESIGVDTLKLDQDVVGNVCDDDCKAMSTGDDIKDNEYRFIFNTLESFNWSRKETASKLGVSERTLRYKLSKMRECGFVINI